ncbi:MAG: lipase maturation factor family protein [Isosphaeraceae bacterium]
MIVSTFWHWLSDEARRPRYRLTRSVFLRGLALVYLAAFGSLAVQLDGLIGSRGILPAAEFLERAGRFLGTGPAAYWRLPTVFWLDASDRALHTVCWGGVLLSVALLCGLLPGYCALLLWVSYLSLAVAGQVFLGYQWDSLLLETGLLAVLIAPWGLRLKSAGDRPWWLAIWLVRWLAFRLMFLSGAVKLGSHDPTWRDWTALEYHYQTQPLPASTSWWIHQMPAWFQGLSVGFMFYAELVAPFFIFGPRPIRLAGFASLVLLQLLIAATGNYGFFNLLAVVVCLCILDDRDWEWLIRFFRRARQSAWEQAEGTLIPSVPGKAWSWPRRLAVGVPGAILVAITGAQTVGTVLPEVVVPSELVTLSQWAEPFRSTNGYGLFAVMTRTRPEIIVEGSDDGGSWMPYRFRWKPCELDRRPRFSSPHLPRLDWQMWFAALGGDCRAVPWFFQFEQRLLEGSPAVLSLLRENPFPARPPRYVRARLYLYRFTSWDSPNWWSREDRGFFCPPLSLEYLK